ncbi:MAG: bestrophin family ion channel [Cyclobacteriaceae bacterium]
MQRRRRYTFMSTFRWTSKYIIYFLILDTVPVILFQLFDLEWMKVPWQPISLIGIAVAFYLGFKNNSSYERLWEARKIWGGVVNASRSFTVMARDFVNNDSRAEPESDERLSAISRRLVDRHIAWLHAMTFELRKPREWEHRSPKDDRIREKMGGAYKEGCFENIKKYLSDEEFQYVMSKGNRSSHLVSQQSRDLMQLRQAGTIEHFRHLAMQDMITELYTLQGKSERIKNFPFPRQYATVNYFFVVMFIILLPFGMMDVFSARGSDWVWFAIPFSVIGSWVFWTMEMIGDYSENPFEGLYNDVPISTLARSIEIDILEMLDENDLPAPSEPVRYRNMVLDM